MTDVLRIRRRVKPTARLATPAALAENVYNNGMSGAGATLELGRGDDLGRDDRRDHLRHAQLLSLS